MIRTRLDKDQILGGLAQVVFWDGELGGRLSRRGSREWKGRSPFRDDKHPSFNVNIEKGVWHDWGMEGEKQGGDVIDFIQHRYGLDFQSSLQYIADTYLGGAPSHDYTPVAPKVKEKPPAREYPPEDFQFIEAVNGHFHTRKAGCMVERPTSLLLDCYGRPEVGESFASVFFYPALACEYRANPNTGTDGDKGWGAGSIAGYEGPVKVRDGLHFDFDHEEPAHSLVDVRAFTASLIGAYHVAPQNIRVFFSGKKGFHVIVLDPSFQAQPGSEAVPEAIKKACTTLAGHLESFDPKVYNRTSLFRIPNSKHGKTGLYKIPLTLSEVDTQSLEAIRDLARTQRRVEKPCHVQDSQSSVGKLVA